MTQLNKSAAAIAVAGALILGCSLSGHGQEMRLRVAQDDGMPPADVGAPGTAGAPDSPAAAEAAPDDASLLIRIEKLEEQIRQMNGQIEQMQFDNHRLEDQLRKFQEDVDFRFQEGGRGKPLPKRSEAPEAVPAPAAVAPVATDAGSPTTPAATPARSARGDAFDPRTDPNAPGAPRPLGGLASAGAAPTAAPVNGSTDASDDDSDTPLNLPSSDFKAAAAAPKSPAAAQPQLGTPASPVTTPAAPVTTPGGTVIASTEVNPTKEEFDIAFGYFKQKDYDNAERSFAAFLEKNPKNRWTSDALYYLGETYYQRGRQREAAEQYLKISTDYAASPRAPEAMLRLGESLQALGAKEQACATFSEVPRKYPNASAAVKAGAEREAKRAQC